MKKLIILFSILLSATVAHSQSLQYEVSNDGNGYQVNATSFDTLANSTTVQMAVTVWITGDACHLEKVYNTSYEVQTTDYTEALRYAPKFAYIFVQDSLPCTKKR